MTAINYADKVALGSGQATAVYLGVTKVWPPFKPNQIAGCTVWLDASQLNLPTYAVLSSWPNLGSGSQPTIVGYPYFEKIAGRNGKPVVQLSENDRLRFYSGTGVDKDWTLIYYARKHELYLPGRFATAFSTASNLLVGYHGNEFNQCYIEGWLTSGTFPTHTTQWRLYSADSTSSAPARFFIDGVLNASGSMTPAKGWGGTLCINGYTDDGVAATAQAGNFEVAELLMYNRRLSDAERQQVENYLRLKWGVVSQPFTPADLGSQLRVWLDGADAASVEITGGRVSKWVNKGKHASTFTQSTAANRPTYANQTVNFQANTGEQLLTNANFQPYDFAFVGRPHDFYFSPPRAGSEPRTDSFTWRTLLRSTAHPIIAEQGTRRFGTYNGGFFQAGTLTWGYTWGIGYGRFGPAAPVQLSIDGGALASTGTTLGTTALLFVQNFGGYGTDQAWGDIKEAIFVSSTALQTLLEGYLAHKWGLAYLLPAGHPYKTIPP